MRLKHHAQQGIDANSMLFACAPYLPSPTRLSVTTNQQPPKKPKTTPENQWLSGLISNGNVEVRCISKSDNKIYSGIYDNLDLMLEQLRFAEKRGWDVYTTINPSRITATNANLRPYQRATKNTDITGIRNIFFDLDPIRDSGTEATDEQIQDAITQGERLSDFLYDFGWYAPTVGFSGNGVHYMYSVDMTIDEASSFAVLYKALALRFTNDEVDFDVTVKNPARISRVYGTTNRKSNRRSYCTVAGDITPATVVLDTIRALTPPKEKSTWVRPPVSAEQKNGKSGYIPDFDIVEAFQRAGLYLKHVDGNMHHVRCINESAHSTKNDSSTIIYADKWPTFFCHHSHCSELTILDVIKQLP